MNDDKCVRCGLPARDATVYRGWRLCHGSEPTSCYDIALRILRSAENYESDIDVAALQQRLEECWALLQVHSPAYLRSGVDHAFPAAEEVP